MSREVGVLLKIENRRRSQNGLVQNLASLMSPCKMENIIRVSHLQEVDPDQDRQNDSICLPLNPIVLGKVSKLRQRQGIKASIHLPPSE